MSIARPKPVSIELDRERHLLYTWRAYWRYEDATGESFLSVLDILEKRDMTALRVKQLVHLVWCGLVHEDETLTPEAVADMIHAANMEHVFAAVNQAIAQSQPREEDARPIAGAANAPDRSTA